MDQEYFTLWFLWLKTKGALVTHPFSTWPLAVVVLISLLLQIFMPIASDEAYFIAWGKSLYAGVYDHPPLTGWVSYFIRQIGTVFGLEQHGILHRLFSSLLGLLALWLIVLRLRDTPANPAAAVVAFAVLPGSLLMFNLYLNDTFVGFFALLFVLAVDLAMRVKRNAWLAIVLAGLSFAALLLSKYNGAVVYLGLILALLTWPKIWGFLFRRMVLISLVALVPFLLHLWWNYNNCSINLAFNFGFRTQAATGFGPLWLFLTLVLMAGPVGLLALWHLRRPDEVGFFTRTFLGILSIMLAIAVWRGEFGINWGTPLGPIAILALAEIKPKAFSFAGRAGAVLSLLILLPLCLMLVGLKTGQLQTSDFRPNKDAHAVDRILDLDDGNLVAALTPLASKRVLVAMDYGSAASLENSGFAEVTVFSRSIYGRNQDMLTDFVALDGRDMVILPQEQLADRVMAEALFDSYEIKTIQTKRRAYEVILGYGFSYEKYHKNWINPVITELYDTIRFPYHACYMDKYR